MKELKNVISYLQKNDSNGTYPDMIEEIKEGNLTIEEAKEYCIDTLNQWWYCNLTDEDIKERNTITKLIASLTDNNNYHIIRL